jgi:hypothetical protein
MDIDYSSLSEVLKNPIRRKVILALQKASCMSYVDLMGAVEVPGTGKFNYHLKILSDLIQKDQNGKYCLTEKGLLAAEFIQKFPAKQIELGSLRMSDAALIGFAGFAATVCNPVLLVGFLLSGLHLTVQPFPVLIVFGVLALSFLERLCGCFQLGVGVLTIFTT